MKVFITGGTGFVGKTITDALRTKGNSVTILSRRKGFSSGTEGLTYIHGDPTLPGKWQEHVSEHDTIINLAGASIFTRWTKKKKQILWDSRINTTRNLVDAIESGTVKQLFSTSAVGYYGFRGDEKLTEEAESGHDFLSELTRQWEETALGARNKGVEVFIMRFGIVLGKKGGMLQMIKPLFKYNLGSPIGSGKQWFSWIHERDLTNIFLFLMEREPEHGVINCTSPNPVQNREFTQTLARVMNKWTILPPVPGFIVKIVFGELGDVILHGQRVIPERLLDMGFEFQYPTLETALGHLIGT